MLLPTGCSPYDRDPPRRNGAPAHHACAALSKQSLLLLLRERGGGACANSIPWLKPERTGMLTSAVRGLSVSHVKPSQFRTAHSPPGSPIMTIRKQTHTHLITPATLTHQPSWSLPFLRRLFGRGNPAARTDCVPTKDGYRDPINQSSRSKPRLPRREPGNRANPGTKMAGLYTPAIASEDNHVIARQSNRRAHLLPCFVGHFGYSPHRDLARYAMSSKIVTPHRRATPCDRCGRP
jgi:hypothetical protein